MKLKQSIPTGILLVMTGCTMAPTYTRPKPEVPATWPTTAPATATAPTTAPATRPAALPEWHDFFSDPRLKKVIELALKNNQDLRLAALNVQRTRQLYGIQRSELLPTATADASFTRQRTPRALSVTGNTEITNQYSVGAGFGWEVDLFGRIQSLSHQALQEYLASEEGRRSVQIMLISQVAESYLTLAADREGLTLAEETLKTQQDSYALIQRLVQRGQAPEIDLHRAQTQVDSARVALASYTQRIAQDENALQLLTGVSLPVDLIPADLGQVRGVSEIRAGVPSDVLLNRPDILQAEHHLQGANANIGAARAAFFPRITLTGAAGLASPQLSNLFEGDSRTWNFGPQVTLPIFDPRTWLALPVSKTDRQIAVTQYQKAIQTGFREVADALAVQKTVGDQVAAQQSLVHAVSETYRLSYIRYNRGLDTYLDVLDAQRSLFAQQQTLISLNLAQRASQTHLYAVLGGGGHIADDNKETKPTRQPK